MKNKQAQQLMFRETPALWVDTCIKRRILTTLRQSPNKVMRFNEEDTGAVVNAIEYELDKWFHVNDTRLSHYNADTI